MRIVERAIFTFEELDDTAKAKAIESFRHIDVQDNYWYDFLFTSWQERLEAMGFVDPQIKFRLNYSQGDYAKFTCKKMDMGKFLEHIFLCCPTYKKAKLIQRFLLLEKKDALYYEVNIECYVDVNAYNSCMVNGEVDILESIIGGKWSKLNRMIFDSLKDEYEYLTSDAYISQRLIDYPDYEFCEDGTPYHGCM